MMFRMIRSQTGERGTYRLGVAYDPQKDASVIKEAKAFIEAGFAEEVTAEQLKKEKAVLEKLSMASVAPAKPGSEKAALRAAQKVATDAQTEADDAKTEAAALKESLAAANSEVADLKAQIAELLAAPKDESGKPQG